MVALLQQQRLIAAKIVFEVGGHAWFAAIAVNNPPDRFDVKH
jgi:hypothetical protein